MVRCRCKNFRPNEFIIERNITPRFKGHSDGGVLFDWLLTDQIDVLYLNSFKKIN